MITWEELVELEPGILELEKFILSRIPTNDLKLWDVDYKPILNTLVGYRSKSNNPILRTVEAHTVAYQYHSSCPQWLPLLPS